MVVQQDAQMKILWIDICAIQINKIIIIIITVFIIFLRHSQFMSQDA